MIVDTAGWNELAARFRIVTEGPWRKSVNMRVGRYLEAQIFSSSSLEFVHGCGAFSIIRTGGRIGAVNIGRFTAIGPGLVCTPPEHPLDALGTSSVFLKDYPWARSGDEDGDGFYDVPQSGRTLMTRLTIIGSDVWIGQDVYIKGGLTIGDGAVIAARSVVTRDVPPYAVVAGSPARHVRNRFPDRIVAALLEARWWDLDPAWMAEVDQGDIEACTEFLGSERSRIPPLRPKVVVFARNNYKVRTAASRA